MFALEALGGVDDAWRVDGRKLVASWIEGATDETTSARTSAFRHLNRNAIQWIAARIDPHLVTAIAACPEPTVFELSPWGHWTIASIPGLKQLLMDGLPER